MKSNRPVSSSFLQAACIADGSTGEPIFRPVNSRTTACDSEVPSTDTDSSGNTVLWAANTEPSAMRQHGSMGIRFHYSKVPAGSPEYWVLDYSCRGLIVHGLRCQGFAVAV